LSSLVEFFVYQCTGRVRRGVADSMGGGVDHVDLVDPVPDLFWKGGRGGGEGGGGIHSFTPPPVVFTLQNAEINEFMYRVQGALTSVFVAQKNYRCS
jgi:hypothetical protein